MKTFTTSFAAIIFALSTLTSCGPAALDIDITELKEPCDFADAMLTVATEVKELIGEGKINDLEGDDKKEAQALRSKARSIENWFEIMVINEDDFDDCPSAKKLKDLKLRM